MYTILITIVAFILLLLCGALSYACWNLLKKVSTYEKWVEHFRTEIDNVAIKLKLVDEKNLFEKDDDVGFVFSEILRVTNEFNDLIK